MRWELRDPLLLSCHKGSLGFRKLLDTLEGSGVTSRWTVRLGRLFRFSLAKVLLYK